MAFFCQLRVQVSFLLFGRENNDIRIVKHAVLSFWNCFRFFGFGLLLCRRRRANRSRGGRATLFSLDGPRVVIALFAFAPLELRKSLSPFACCSCIKLRSVLMSFLVYFALDERRRLSVLLEPLSDDSPESLSLSDSLELDVELSSRYLSRL